MFFTFSTLIESFFFCFSTRPAQRYNLTSLCALLYIKISIVIDFTSSTVRLYLRLSADYLWLCQTPRSRASFTEYTCDATMSSAHFANGRPTLLFNSLLNATHLSCTYIRAKLDSAYCRQHWTAFS